ncbi:nucleotidyltransferase family protein [Bacteroidota bacterium]
MHHPREAIILAGGKGTRLQTVVKDIPKPMAPIGDKPFLEYILKYLEGYKMEHVVLSVGYKWKTIEQYFGKSFGSMKLSYAVEEEPLGTGGGIRLSMDHLIDEHAFILNGDTFFNINLHDLSEFYFAHKADMCMTVKRKRDFFRYGTVQLDVCKVIGFREKRPVKNGLINAGVYIMGRPLLTDFERGEPFSFETDFLQKELKKLKICAMQSQEYFIDIGVPADYQKACTELPGIISA